MNTDLGQTVMPHPINRRDFIKSGLLAAAAGAVGGSKAIAQEAERQVAREQMSKDILNYNPQMQYRPMGRTGVNVSALGAAIFAYVYNNYVLHQNKERAMADYTVSMSPVQRGDPASSCIACGECLAKCPQHLDIPSLLAKVKETMGK